MVCLSRATHQVVVHLEQHTTNKFSRCDRASINRWFLTDRNLTEKARFIYNRHPDMPLTSPYTSRSSRIIAPSDTPGNPSGGGVAYSGPSRTLGSPCMNASSPFGQRPLGLGGRQNLERDVDRRQFWCWATMFDLVDVRIFEAVHAPSGLGLVPSNCLVLVNQREEITRSRYFSLITSACAGSMIVTALKSSTPCHSVSTALQDCVRSSADRCFHDTSSAFRRLRWNYPRSGLTSADAIGKVSCSLHSPT